jgi:hypothetical protein
LAPVLFAISPQLDSVPEAVATGPLNLLETIVDVGYEQAWPLIRIHFDSLPYPPPIAFQVMNRGRVPIVPPPRPQV